MIGATCASWLASTHSTRRAKAIEHLPTIIYDGRTQSFDQIVSPEKDQLAHVGSIGDIFNIATLNAQSLGNRFGQSIKESIENVLIAMSDNKSKTTSDFLNYLAQYAPQSFSQLQVFM
jgi:hypothetical protein